MNKINQKKSESIKKINSEILKQSHIAIDTEFMRERTYFAKLCLVQIATPSSIFCIDTISNDNLKEFWNCISNSSCIFHSARQDLEVIFQNSDLLPNKIFDTQIAAGLVGFEPQISYANLVEKLCGKVLKKSLLLDRLGTMSDLIGLSILLASDESNYITAQTISVNGGAWVR